MQICFIVLASWRVKTLKVCQKFRDHMFPFDPARVSLGLLAQLNGFIWMVL